MTLKRAFLRGLAIAALIAAPTEAGKRVFSPKDTPTWDGEYPLIVVRNPLERKESLGRVSAPQFTTTATMTITAQLEASTGELAETHLEIMAEQIERALINDYNLTKQIQQFAFVESRIDTSSEGKAHMGVLTMAFGLEFYQGPEDFAPIETAPLETVVVTADMAGPFDAQGIYPNPPYPSAVTTPPRTTGPDGRAETGLTINFPSQE